MSDHERLMIMATELGSIALSAQEQWETLKAAQALVSRLTIEEEALRLDISKLRANVATLEDEIERLTNLSTPPVPAPSSLPDVTIFFGDYIFRPTGPGELWTLSGERCWTFEVGKEITVHLDVKGKQKRIYVQRAWSDLPNTAPVITMPVRVMIDGEEMANAPLRIHHHTRPCLTFNRLPMPTFDLTDWKRRAIIPNYSSKVQSPDAKTVASHWQWDLWSDKNPAGSYDLWSEDYGLANAQWAYGVPLSNEASMISAWDVALLHPKDEESRRVLWDICADTADSSGNYAIHHFDRTTGAPCLYDSPAAAAIPMLNADNLPALTSETGLKLPQGDIAHDMALCNVMALLTGERFYVEELEAWTLLGHLARKGADRASGIYWSGQVRSNAWWLRNVYHLCLVHESAQGWRTDHFRDILVRNLRLMNERFTSPNSSENRPTGICSVDKRTDTAWDNYADPSPSQTSTGNLHFVSHVLGEIHRSRLVGDLALPMLTYTLRAAKGVWDHSPDHHLCGWLKHMVGADPKTDTWDAICKRTFAKIPATIMKEWKTPLTHDIVAWHRAACVAAANLGEQWAVEAVAWIDGEFARIVRLPSIAWQIDVSKDGGK